MPHLQGFLFIIFWDQETFDPRLPHVINGSIIQREDNILLSLISNVEVHVALFNMQNKALDLYGFPIQALLVSHSSDIV